MLHAPKIIKDFLGYMQTIKGKSPKTVDEYYIDLRTFFRYMKKAKGLSPADIAYDKVEIDDINLDFVKKITITDVFEYMNYLIEERNNSAATRARKSSSLRAFFDYLVNKVELIDTNPVKQLDTPKRKKGLPKYLTLEQSMELLRSVVESTSEFKDRDYCILTLFLNCGMRLSELVNINYDDIYDDGTMKIVGKGNKERIVYLNHACIDAIKRYKAVRQVDGVKDKKALFLSRLKKRISIKTVQYMVKEYLSKIGLGGKGYSVHKLRHTAATLMYQHGQVDIRVLKDILGHQNLGTTEIYTHLSNKQMERAINSNPLSDVILTPSQDKKN